MPMVGVKIQSRRPGFLEAIACQPKTSNHGAWLQKWKAGQRKTVYLCALVLGASTLVSILFLEKIWASYIVQSPGHPPMFNDFFALWSYSAIARSNPAAELYDFAALHARQVALGMDPSEESTFPYPPTFILFLWPLSLLPYGVAYCVWTFGTLVLFVGAIWKTCSRLPLCLLGALVGPATIVTIYSGQSGLLAAALIIAGVRFARNQPILGGILIGLLTYKPQLGFLVPVALVGAGLWPAFGVACVTALVLTAAATLAFGLAVWPAWLSFMPEYVAIFDKATWLVRMMPTVMANSMMVGVPMPVAEEIQAAAALVIIVLVWRCFRRDAGQLAMAALLVGTFLATPHAFVYDLPMLSAALALVIQERTEAGASFCLAEICILLITFIFPVLMIVKGFDVPVSIVSLVLFFGLILRREKQTARRYTPIFRDTSGGSSPRQCRHQSSFNN